MSDKREHIRHPLTVKVKISHPDIGELIVKTKNLSHGGLFVLVEPSQMPPVGEIVQGQVLGEADDLPIVMMKIVRTEDDGLGLQFIDV